jgi:hypothetical protein
MKLEGESSMTLTRLPVLFFVFALTMTAAAGVLSAQQPNDPPAAPIPTPIFTAKKVFVSNASGEIGCLLELRT